MIKLYTRHPGFGAIFFLLFLGCMPTLWQQVDIAERRGDPREGIRLIEQYLSLHPKDARAYFKLGELYARVKKWDAMTEAFRACVQADSRWQPDAESARERYWRKSINAGVQALRRNNARTAQTFFHDAVQIHPGRALSFRLYGEALLADRDTSAALTQFRNAFHLKTEDPVVLRYLMRLTYAAGDDTASVHYSQLLLKQLPEDAEALRLTAYSFDHLNKVSKAVEFYEKVNARGDRPEDLLAYAAFQYRQGEYEKSIALTRLANSLGADSLQCLNAIAQCQLMLKDFTGLKDTAHTMLTANPDDLTALQLLQIAFAALGNTRKVKAIAARIHQLSPQP